MRQAILFLWVAVAAPCILCANCHYSEPQRGLDAADRVGGTPSELGVQRASSSRDEAVGRTAPIPLLDPPFQTTATEHFVLHHEPGAGYVAGACRTLEYAYENFYEVFSQAGFDLSRSKDRLVWICFPHKSSFSRYALQAEGMDLSWLDGYYSTLTNRVAIVQRDQGVRRAEEAVPSRAGDSEAMVAAHRSPQEGVLAMAAAGQPFDVTRLTHEVAHQLSFNSGIQKRGVVYPLWISEGLATNFEFDGTGTMGVAHGNAARCKGLLEAYAAGELAPLWQFVVQTTVAPDLRAGRRTYAQAWGFFQFILSERPAGLRTYLQHIAEDHLNHQDDATLLAEFRAAFGSPDALEASWNAFLARQAQQDSAGRVATSVAVTRTP